MEGYRNYESTSRRPHTRSWRIWRGIWMLYQSGVMMTHTMQNSDSPPSNASINGNGSLPSPPSAPISYPVNPLSNPASPGLPPNAPNHHPSERMPFDAIPKAPPGGDMGAFPTNTGSYLPQDQYYSPPPQNMGGYPVQQPSTQQFPMYSPPSGSGAAAVPYQKPPAGTDLDTRTKDAMELCAFAMTALKVFFTCLLLRALHSHCFIWYYL